MSRIRSIWFVIAVAAAVGLPAASAAAQSTDPAATVDLIVANAIEKIDKASADFEKKIVSLTNKTRKTWDRMRYRNVDPAEINDYLADVADRAEALAFKSRSKAESVLAYADRRLAKYGSPPGRLEEVQERADEHFERILELLDQLDEALLDLGL